MLDSGALLLYFPAPQTVTGEDVIEFHVHGGPAVVKAVLKAIPKAVPSKKTSYVRYAEPGEFTRRAFYNGRLDLTQIEALGDTLAAETEQQRQLAVRGTTNTLANRYEAWRQKLLYARGELEALIDFSEDQHFEESPHSLVKSVADQVQGLKYHIQANIENASRGELLRNGINIALLGAPNAGKSSLLNKIVGREAAIVSKEAGTTRDVIEISVDIGGFFCKFGDLAGLRGVCHGQYLKELSSVSAIGEVEEEGIRRAKERALNADVILVVLSVEPNASDPSELRVDINTEVLDILSKCDLEKQQLVCIVNKCDLVSSVKDIQVPQLESLLHSRNPDKLRQGPQRQPFFISCKSSSEAFIESQNPGGIQVLLEGLITIFKSMTSAVSMPVPAGSGQQAFWEESLGASERQRLLLVQCQQRLDEFLAIVSLSETEARDQETDIVLAAESLRAAGECLAKISGKGEAGDVEEVLGVVFEKYCMPDYVFTRVANVSQILRR